MSPRLHDDSTDLRQSEKNGVGTTSKFRNAEGRPRPKEVLSSACAYESKGTERKERRLQELGP